MGHLTHQQTKQRGFATPVTPNDAQLLALIDHQGSFLQKRGCTLVKGYVLQGNHLVRSWEKGRIIRVFIRLIETINQELQ